MSDAFTNEITITYDSCDPAQATRPKVTSMVQELGSGQSRTVTFTYDGNHLHTMSYLGRTWTYNWIGDLLTSVDLPVGGSWTFGYWGTWVHSVTTPNGGAVEYLFNAALENPPVEARFWGNAGWGFDRRLAPSGDFEVVVESQLNTTTYTFPYNSPFPGTPSARVVTNGEGQEVEREDLFWVEGTPVGLQEVVDGQIRKPTTPLLQQRRITRGGVQWYTTYYYHDWTTFNDYGQPWQIEEAGDVAGRTTTREFWDSPALYIRGKVSKVTVSGGGQSYETSWNFRYDGFVNSKTVFGVTTTYGADSFGKIAWETDANGRSTAYQQYSWGLPQQVTAPQHSVARSINPDGTVEWEERNGYRYVFTYDDLGRETNRRLQNGGNSNSPVNNDIGTEYAADYVKTSRELSSTTTLLDGYGRTVGTENAEGVKTTIRYNGWGGREFVSLPFTGTSGPGTTFIYDALGRVTQESKPNGTTTYGYSPDGRTITIKDEKLNETVQVWDVTGHPSLARLASVTENDGVAGPKTTSYTYDVLGTLTGVTHPDGSTRAWTYGAHHWLEQETHPESGTVTHGYTGDQVGNVKRRTDANGTQLNYAYDGENRLTDITVGSGGTADDIHFAYDGWGNRTEVSNGFVSRVLTFQADRLTQVTEWVRPTGTGSWSVPFVTDYGPDGNDNVETITYPGGARRTVRYQYNNANQVKKVWDGDRVYADSFSYHPSGRIASFTSGNGVVNTITSDEPHGSYWTHQIVAQKDGHDPVLSLHYGYDDAGNVETVEGPASGSQDFAYDSLNRLTSASGSWGTETYRYDSIGNRTWKNHPTGTEYHYSGGRLASATGVEAEILSYDPVGNLLSDSRGTYTYTPFNMLRQAAMSSGVTAVYGYDGDHLRVVRTVGADQSFSLRGGEVQVLSEVKSDGSSPTWLRDYIYAGPRLIASVAAGASVGFSVPWSSVGEGAGLAQVGVTVTTPDGSPLGEPISVDYATSDGTATAGSDYVAVSGTLTFPAGSPSGTARTISVSVLPDTLNEQNETFTVRLVGTTSEHAVTILDDDPLPALSVNSPTVTEGHSGTTPAGFVVSLSAVSGRAVTVNYATANGTATAGLDYSAVSSSVTIPAGQTTIALPVQVLGDVLVEPSETFTVTLSGPQGATIQTAVGTCSIIDDDQYPTVTIGPVTVVESTYANVSARFPLTLSVAYPDAITVHYATTPGTAGPADFASTEDGVFTVPANTTVAYLPIAVTGDTELESTETFTVALMQASGAVIGSPASATGTIEDDEGNPRRHWYVAEGSTVYGVGGFLEDLLVYNPNSAGTHVAVQYLLSNGTVVPYEFDLGPKTRRTLRVNTWVQGQDVSAIVDSTSQDILVERTMTWNGARGGHNGLGVTSPAPVWYLAEGTTFGDFNTYVLLANPGSDATNVDVTFYRQNGGPLTQTYLVGGHSRVTVWANGIVGGGQNFWVAARSNGGGIIVERSMYWGTNWEGGHETPGVVAAATEWKFAEGSTGTGLGFATYFTIANPHPTAAAAVQVQFTKWDGSVVTQPYTVAAGARQTVCVGDVAGMAGVPGFATVVRSTNGVGVVAERSMYWSNWVEGHNTSGATASATSWWFAEGRQGMLDGLPYDSYFPVLNEDPVQTMVVHAEYALENGTTITQDYTVLPNRRYTIWAGDVPALAGQRFSLKLDGRTVGGTEALPFVAERAVYWGSGWYGGHGSLGVPKQ